ncbi:hypothetical protein [Terriglobus tenax]|uniref:hypothetical protein n=1 Tax=Terriglobus tenax TaxID=1111115 RepID=UPI0021E0355F|nr:hypothetical protein [Terriglobus tenax]
MLFVMCLTAAGAAQQSQTLTVEQNVPLHVRITKTANLKRGQAVEGILTEPIYVVDRMVLPKDAVVKGIVTDLKPAEKKLRVQAWLDGDVTPLHDPVVKFESVLIDGRDVPLDARATIRETKLVRFVPGQQKSGIAAQAKKAAHEKIASVKDQVAAPGMKDRALRLLYSQLPYHPQRIWAGTQMIADLEQPAAVQLPAQEPAAASVATPETLDKLMVKARLATSLSSDTAKRGDRVIAVVTEPVVDAQKKVVLPEGTTLEGMVLESKPSRSFSRNGQLRFDFRSVKRQDEQSQKVHGTLSGAEGSSAANITVDREGGAKANADKNRFVAPLLLGVLAAAAQHQDRDGNGLGRQTVAANGFGLVARVVALTANDRNVATGFGAYAFAKSIYFRFLTRGHAVSFEKDTQVEVLLSAR